MTQKLFKFLLIFISLYIYFVVKTVFNPFINKDYIVFLNVGNGDSILLASGSDYIVLDGGTSSYSLNNLYKYTNFKFPQNYIISHFHSDHTSGFYNIFSNSTTFYDIYMPYTYFQNKEYKKLFKNLSPSSIKPLKLGDTIKLNNLLLTVLWPKQNCNYSKDQNYCSLVVLVTRVGSNDSVLLTADTTKQAQLSYLGSITSKVSLIKVPHHGGENALNIDLLSKLAPKYAIFTVGKNSFGHPHQIVTNYYTNLGTQLFKTNYSGDVIYFFN